MLKLQRPKTVFKHLIIYVKLGDLNNQPWIGSTLAKFVLDFMSDIMSNISTWRFCGY